MSVNFTQAEALNLDPTLTVEIIVLNETDSEYCYFMEDTTSPNDGMTVGATFRTEANGTLNLVSMERIANDHPREEYNVREVDISDVNTFEGFKNLVLEKIVALA
jgi:hypothetical protein